MVFHESLNPERKFSLAIPLVFIAILGGTTAVVEVATVLSPQSSYAVNARSQLASGEAPAGSDKSECTADSPTGQIDPATKKIKQVGKNCKPTAAKGDAGVTVDDGCVPNDYIKAGRCTVIYCSPSKICAEIRQSSEPKNIPQSTPQLFQMVRNVQSAPEGGAEFVGLNFSKISDRYPGPIFAEDLNDEKMGRWERAFANDFDSSIPAPNKGGISTLDEIKGFGGDQSQGWTGSVDDPTDQQLFDQENVARLRAEQNQISAELAKDPNNEMLLYRQEAIAKEIGAQTTFGDTSSGWAKDPNFNFETAGGRAETPETAAFREWSAGLPGANIQGPAYDFNSDALDRSVAKDVGDLKGGWVAATTEQQLENCAYGGCSDELVRDLRNTRIQELENEKNEIAVANAGAGMGVGGDFSDAKQKELDELKTLNAPTETSTPTPKPGEKEERADVPLPTPRPEVKVDVPLPRPVVRDLSGSLDVDVSKIPQGVDMKIGDGLLVTNDGKEIRITDVASGKTEPYYISETKGAKLADLVQDAQIINSPYAQEADSLRKAADSAAKTVPDRAAALRREADKIDPRIPASGPAAKAPIDPNGNQTGAGRTGGGDPTKDNSGSGSGIGSALSSK